MKTSQTGKKTKVKQLTSLLLDGSKHGVMLDIAMNSLKSEVSSEDYEYLLSKFKLHPSYSSNNGKSYIKVRLQGTLAKVSVNKHNNHFFFNLEGNPISFLTGQNVFGHVELPLLILDFYKRVVKAIRLDLDQVDHGSVGPESKFKLPVKIVRNVKNLNLYVNGLSFACYSLPLTEGLTGSESQATNWKQMKMVFDAIDHIYSFALPDAEAEHSTLKESLGLRLVREGPYSLRFDRYVSRNRYWSLALYNKFKEQQDKGRIVNAEACDLSWNWTENRIRFDLTFHNFWFQSKKLKKLSDIHYLYGDDYVGWVQSLFNACLSQIGLQYFLSFNLDLDMGAYARDYKRWISSLKRQTSHASVKASPAAKSWFMRQGLNLDISFESHLIAYLGRATFGFNLEQTKEAILGSEQAVQQLSNQFELGLKSSLTPNPNLNPNYQDILGLAHCLKPDPNLKIITVD